ncbi:50S ribosomal protein L29 [Blattabacterium cuenoti]|uniref:50S ribosomal protein L29 n=1 Tax=Blattabacterium cuenoti TaxID=1653831 RepID=UPI00163B9F63|nr:50S ribosomal protein L29 [Blattabacterium cuenoti]
MKYSDLKILSEKEILKYLENKRNDYKKMKFDHSIGLKKNTMEIRWLRRDIAKLKTEFNRKKAK